VEEVLKPQYRARARTLGAALAAAGGQARAATLIEALVQDGRELEQTA
jgi:UDP:flavonoid glycosyltransferase YjiC (YdhE family)